MVRPPQLDSLFAAAIAINDAGERRAFLDEQCGDDRELRRQVEELLAADSQVGSFLEQPPAMLLPPEGQSVLSSLQRTLDLPPIALRESSAAGPDPITRPRSPETPPKSLNSRYDVQGEIARGGMGAIFKGRDNDLGRDLAIKVLLEDHRERPEVVQRFVEEAQIGGQLQHPGIAPVYELGQFADRRPFFSMKLVKGETLAKLLSERREPADERSRFLGIFEHVCQTMAYAHSRGVIHRDLKPANIMVGAFGEVQVMDWGLAKVLACGGVADERQSHNKHAGRSFIQTLRAGVGSDIPGGFGTCGSETQMGSVMGTPAYMPPEQALGEIDHLDERADVFGLGAILCEILTGQPPYVAEDGTQVFRLAVRGRLEDCFARLNSCDADAELIALAKHCLAPDPKDRPRHAGALAERITSYLRSVERRLREAELKRAEESARADAEAARAAAEAGRAEAEAARVVEQRKRLRITVALAASILAVLTAGIAGTTYQAREAEKARAAESRRAIAEGLAKQAAQEAQQTAEQQRALAEAARKTAEQAAAKEQAANQQAQRRLQQIEQGIELITSIFNDLDIGQVKQGNEPLEAVLSKRLVRAAGQLQGESVGDPLTVAELQVRLGNSLSSLGYPKDAAEIFNKAAGTFAERLGPTHPTTLAAKLSLARAFDAAGELQSALKLYEEVLRFKRTAEGDEALGTLAVQTAYAKTLFGAGRDERALPMLEQVLNTRREKLGPKHPLTIASMRSLGSIYFADGKLAMALPLLEEALKLERELPVVDEKGVSSALRTLALIYESTGKLNESIALREELLQQSRRRLGSEHPETLKDTRELATALVLVGKRQAALALVEDALKLSKSRLGESHPATLEAMEFAGIIYLQLDKSDLAQPLLTEALKRRKANRSDDDPKVIDLVVSLASCHLVAKKPELAAPLLEQALNSSRKGSGDKHPATRRARNYLATAYTEAGQPEKALPLCEESLADSRSEFGDSHPHTTKIMVNLGRICWRVGRLDRSVPLFEEALPLLERQLGRKHVETREVITDLALNYVFAGRPAEAIPYFEEVYAQRQEHPELNAILIGLFDAYFAAEKYEKALPLVPDYLQLVRTTAPPNSPRRAQWLATAGSVLLKMKSYAEAEPVWRDCLAIREPTMPEHWSTSNARSMLGGALLGQRKYEEAEPLLVQGYEGMLAREARIPKEGQFRVTEALERLIELYQALDKPAEVQKYQAALDERKKAEQK